jgi:CRISPR-associated protein Cmr3
MRIFIEPTEPLLFRTGRPFTAGENTFAESLFPPTPETLQGALRATIAIQWGQAQEPPISTPESIFAHDALTTLIGKREKGGDTYGQFRITGMTLGRRNPSNTGTVERLFPPPAHLMVTLESGSKRKLQQLTFLRPVEQEPGTTNMPADYALPFPVLHDHKTAGKSEPLTDWLTPSGLKSVLQGDLPRKSDEHRVKTNEIYTHEPRLGIGMHDHAKTTREGYLYQVQMIRMQPGYGFVIDLACGEKRYGASETPPVQEQQRDASHDLAFLSTGWLTLGGEQRAARFTVLKGSEERDEAPTTKEGNLLYFATPTYFKQGWLPEDQSLIPSRPLSAVIMRYQSIGGWYLDPRSAGGGGKVMHRCVPAGSVYFFDQKVTVNRPLTEYGWQIGYGIAYTGEWKR